MAATTSQPSLKRLLDEPQDNLLKRKHARLAPPPPSPGLAACLGPVSSQPRPGQRQPPARVGPYLLSERCEREETYRAVHAHTQQQYTCQVLPLLGYQEQLAAYNRVGKHENICGPLDVVIRQGSAYVFLPAHHGDMHAYMRSRKRLAEEEAGHLFAQMLSAVAHCHRHGVILRDLKLRRFVFTDRYRTRLVLLGLNDCVVLRGSHDDDSLTDRHGCPAYVGPELLTNGSGSYSGLAADIWSLGVSLYTMLVGRYPFQDTQPAALFAKIRRGAFGLPDWLSPQARCLVCCMLRKSPAERLKAGELQMHPWMSSAHAAHPNAPKTHDAHNPALPGKPDDEDQVVPTWSGEP
ncbi:unnamed protein product [Menidia menidia]|uniref:(Atlantic silverside) hypothetical protein n=1 Tax=Menidia menidia TaxID=238744 RepID=A0A8S4BGJ4_9TELE|nr:unnamed protein product [Menidia menidia]